MSFHDNPNVQFRRFYKCFARLCPGGVRGIESFPVNVETDISNGMPTFEMVGYVGGEVREAKDRVCTALANTGHSIPVARITVNLSPGDVKKSGIGFDLPVAVGVLVCMGEIGADRISDVFIAGELSLWQGGVPRSRQRVFTT